MAKADLSRVAVVGTTCSSKTTFAGRLAALLEAPHAADFLSVVERSRG